MLMQKAGYKIIGLADIGGGLYNENGFDVPKAIDWVYTQKKPLQDFPGGGAKMTARDVLFQPCEIAGSRRHRKSDHRRRTPNRCRRGSYAKAQTAPPPGTPTRSSTEKGIFTIPDILGNAGGVTVSYFEWVQDRQGFFWRESEVNERLHDVMDKASIKWYVTPKRTG